MPSTGPSWMRNCIGTSSTSRSWSTKYRLVVHPTDRVAEHRCSATRSVGWTTSRYLVDQLRDVDEVPMQLRIHDGPVEGMVRHFGVAVQGHLHPEGEPGHPLVYPVVS